jgi:hypothetical protein
MKLIARLRVALTMPSIFYGGGAVTARGMCYARGYYPGKKKMVGEQLRRENYATREGNTLPEL